MPHDILETLSDQVVGDRGPAVIGSKGLLHLLLVLGFIKYFFLEAHGKGFETVIEAPGDDRGDQRRIQASAQVGPDRDVRPESETGGVDQKGFQCLCRLFKRPFPMIFRRINRQGPEGLPGYLAVSDRHIVARRQFMNAFKYRVRAQGGPEGECLAQGLRIDLPGNRRVHEEGLDFRSKEEFSACCRVEEGPDPDSVSCQKQLFFSRIPDGQGELAVHFFQAFRPQLLVQVDDHLCVRPGGKHMTFLDQLLL